jgi:hypothetical protein
MRLDNKKSNKNIHFLTNDSLKYWNIVYSEKLYNKDKSLIYPYYFYSFDVDNNYCYFYKRGKKRVRDIGGDVITENNWDFINDSLIKLNGCIYKVKLLTQDTFKYEDLKGSINILAKSDHQKSDIDTIERVQFFSTIIDSIR